MHVYQQIEGGVEGVLAGLVGLDAWIRESLLSVDGEYQAVGQDFHGVSVELAGLDASCGSVGRIAALFQRVSVVRMYRLVGYAVVVEVFHDVYFPSVWPFLLFRQHPKGRPGSAGTAQPGAYLHLAIPYVPLAFGVQAAGHHTGSILLVLEQETAVVLHAPQDEFAFPRVVESCITGHVPVPVRCATVYLAPGTDGGSLSPEILFPYEVVSLVPASPVPMGRQAGLRQKQRCQAEKGMCNLHCRSVWWAVVHAWCAVARFCVTKLCKTAGRFRLGGKKKAMCLKMQYV